MRTYGCELTECPCRGLPDMLVESAGLDAQVPLGNVNAGNREHQRSKEGVCGGLALQSTEALLSLKCVHVGSRLVFDDVTEKNPSQSGEDIW